MAKKRTAWEQVKSGFRIAGNILLGFTFFVALSISISFLTLRNNLEHQGAHPLLGGFSLMLLSGVLFLTTQIWARWLFAVFAYSAARLLFGVWFVTLGTNPRVDPKTAFQAILVVVLSTLATAKFLRRAPLGAERLGLLLFFICLVFAAEYQSLVPWYAGLAILAAGHAIHFLMGHHVFMRRQTIDL
jgi:hypothetical protein